MVRPADADATAARAPDDVDTGVDTGALDAGPGDIDPSEATYVSPLYLRAPAPPKVDTDREFPAASDPAEDPPAESLAPPAESLAPPAEPLAPDAEPPAGSLAPAPADAFAPPAEPFAPPAADPLAPPPADAFAPPSLESLPPAPVELAPPAPGDSLSFPPLESLPPEPEAPILPPPGQVVGAAFSSPGAPPAMFSQAAPLQSLLARPVSTALPVTGAHPAFGFPAASTGPEPILLPGSIVGRYAIHSHIGVRGTGALYRAHDPRLGRDVALQMWRASAYLPAAASPAGMRFLQQARALAQVSHPHVRALLDVGAVGPNVFLTMEAFQGVPLDRWLAQAPRKLARILDVFVKVGRGLAAVHAAGLLHGDLQPAHVLVGKGNDVRVIDFGLTRALAEASPPADAPARALTDPGIDPRFARAGSSITDLELGDFGRDEAATEIDISVRDALPTEIDMDPDRVFGQLGQDDAAAGQARPGGDNRPPLSPYAAPEEHAGGPSSARSDQYSFCAALYHAVCGVEPFAGDTPEARLESARAGRLSPPAPGRLSRNELPPWLQALFARGLAAAPGDRYESMDALLTELEAGRKRRARRLRWAAIAVAVLGSFAVGAIYAGAGGDGACADARKRVDTVWNEGVIQAMAGAFSASGAPGAEDTHGRVVAVLDDYTRAWTETHAGVCASPETAAAGAPETDPEALEAARAERLACLSGRLRELQALAGALSADVDRVAVEHAVGAAARLPSVAACASPAAPVPTPEDERARAELAAIEVELAAARAQVDLGRHERLAAPARALLDRATASGHLPAQARAQVLLARIQSAAAEHGQAEVGLRQALRLAEQGQDRELAAEIWVHLVESIGLSQGRHDEAAAMREAAEAAVAAARMPDLHRSALFGRMAVVLAELGRHEPARPLAERAQALVSQTRGPDSIHEIEPLEALGRVLQRQGRHRDALGALERALALTERHYGRAHVRQVPVLMAMGGSHLALGQPESALSSFAQARDIEDAYHGSRTALACEIAAEIGRALSAQGKYEEALAPLERAIALGTERYGGEHLRVTPALVLLAEVRAARGEADQAREALERALATRERRLGAEHPDTAQARARLGHVLVELGDLQAARPLLESALAALERARGQAHPDLAPALSGLGALWREDGSERRAKRFLERQVALLRQHLGEQHPAVAAADAELGEALLVVERPAQARAAFARARGILEAEGRAATPVLARVLTGLAACELAVGEAADAVPLLERALDIHTERPGDPVDLARTRFALARALWATRTDRTRALALGQQAEQILAGLGARAARDLAAIREWLESDDL